MGMNIVFLIFTCIVALVLMEFAFERPERRRKKRHGPATHHHS